MNEFLKWIYEQLVDLLAKPAAPNGVAAHVWLGSGYDRDSEEQLIRGRICTWAREQEGARYHLGVENDVHDDHPAEEDCSELVEMAYSHGGKSIPDGSNYQYDFCRAVHEPRQADLGFLWSNAWGRIGHVVIYNGDGQIIEARGGAIGKVRITDRSVIEQDPRFKGWRRHPDFEWPIEERA